MYLCQLANKDGNHLRDVRKTGRFTHVNIILGHDVSEKRFSTHAVERNVARIGEGRYGNDKWMSSAWGE